MAAPVNRCQSPTSVANANAVNVAMPRMQDSRVTTGAHRDPVARSRIALSRRSRRAVVARTVSKSSVKAVCTAAAWKRWERSHRACTSRPTDVRSENIRRFPQVWLYRLEHTNCDPGGNPRQLGSETPDALAGAVTPAGSSDRRDFVRE